MKLLNKRELRAKTSLSQTEIVRKEKAGKFPERIWISTNRVAWVESEVDQWIEDRIKDSRK